MCQHACTSNFVSTQVLRRDTPTQRMQVIARFLLIAAKCVELNNSNAVMEIISGLETSSVQRLKLTWRELSSQSWKLYVSLSALASMKDNFKTCRQLLANSKPPCVPYIGVYLKDLTSIDECNASALGELINFDKLDMQAKLIGRVISMQHFSYDFQPIPEVQNFIKDAAVLTEDSLYETSLLVEPRSLQQVASASERSPSGWRRSKLL
eukprot:TRINITY_DN8008_c0_g1_i1.p1 TRINITY_DN8008_c0_g1~~TRINITY_DN8008_c0_g1_i1.p1  ORF type:complete len:209 (+),score=52.52 TRINITY_DN8008_c0_g1_i1:372-998(+)